MKVITGLGNPGARYEGTRHNIGFEVLSALAEKIGAPLRRSFRFKARVSDGTVGGAGVMLVQPATYMNESGLAVAPIVRKRGCAVSDVIVVLDDTAIELGRLRIRARGSSGGHNGLQSLIQALGSDEFVRVRVGVGADSVGGSLREHVLGRFAPGEFDAVREMVRLATEAVICVVQSGAEVAMNRFNARPAAARPENNG